MAWQFVNVLTLFSFPMFSTKSPEQRLGGIAVSEFSPLCQLSNPASLSRQLNCFLFWMKAASTLIGVKLTSLSQAFGLWERAKMGTRRARDREGSGEERGRRPFLFPSPSTFFHSFFAPNWPKVQTIEMCNLELNARRFSEDCFLDESKGYQRFVSENCRWWSRKPCSFAPQHPIDTVLFFKISNAIGEKTKTTAKWNWRRFCLAYCLLRTMEMRQ